VTLEARDDLLVIDSTTQPAGTCTGCGQALGAGEGITALYGGRVLRFRCSGCLASFRSEPGRFVAAHDYCCDTDSRVESPASEWVV
jgi:hypothetical protein